MAPGETVAPAAAPAPGEDQSPAEAPSSPPPPTTTAADPPSSDTPPSAQNPDTGADQTSGTPPSKGPETKEANHAPSGADTTEVSHTKDATHVSTISDVSPAQSSTNDTDTPSDAATPLAAPAPAAALDGNHDHVTDEATEMVGTQEQEGYSKNDEGKHDEAADRSSNPEEAKEKYPLPVPGAYESARKARSDAASRSKREEMLAPSAEAESEVVHKNAIISRLLDEADARSASIERSQQEVAELKTMNYRLQSELEAVKTQSIERERYINRIAQESTASENIDLRELQRRHRMLGAAYRQDRRKLEMMQQQISQMSASLGTQSQLQTAYSNLRDAHTRQALALQDQQEAAKIGREKASAAEAKTAKYRNTAHQQEQIILKLESMLKASIESSKQQKARIQEGDKEREKLKADLAAVRKELEENQAAAAELPPAGFPNDEQIRLQLRAERAERRAEAVEQEMTDLARESAQEIASLKLKLSEREAKLLSGDNRPPLTPQNY